MQVDNIFQIHSMTEARRRMAAMMLMEQGLLALNDPVEKYLPEFRGQWVVDEKTPDRLTLRRPTRPVSIRDLMTHTSGNEPEPTGRYSGTPRSAE